VTGRYHDSFQELSPAVNIFVATFEHRPMPFISLITAAINTAVANNFRYQHPVIRNAGQLICFTSSRYFSNTTRRQPLLSPRISTFEMPVPFVDHSNNKHRRRQRFFVTSISTFEMLVNASILPRCQQLQLPLPPF